MKKDGENKSKANETALKINELKFSKEIAAKEGFRTMQDMGKEMILSGDLNFREYDRVLSME